MASEFWYVVQNRNRYEKEENKQREADIENLRNEGLFRVALNNELDIIKNIFEDSSIKYVELKVDGDSYMAFGAAFGYEEMQAFDVRLKRGTTDTFIVSKKEVSLY